jgi:muramoyltetrapeptide carboxypeptidase
LLPFSEQSLLRALRHRDDPVGFAPESRTVRSGIAQGRLAGGNLTMLAALAGTAFQADLRGTIVVLEDTGVPVYAIDRMLQQLIMSGSMQSIAGIAFGQLTAMHGSTDPAVDRQLTTTLRNVATTLDVPCLAGLPIGHIDAQWTLPLGRMATLDADAQTVTLHA